MKKILDKVKTKVLEGINLLGMGRLTPSLSHSIRLLFGRRL